MRLGICVTGTQTCSRKLVKTDSSNQVVRTTAEVADMAMKDVTYADVVEAIQEFNTIGRKKFLQKYGMGEANKHLIRFEGAEYVRTVTE